MIKLVLFIISQSNYSERAIRKIHALCEANLKDNYMLKVVDVLERPELAEEKRIFATPTLIREFPGPERRVIGDMSNEEVLLPVLGVSDKLDDFIESDDESAGDD